MTLLRQTSCPAFLAKFQLRRDPWNKAWWRRQMLGHYQRARLERIMAVERRRALPDGLWMEKRKLLDAIG